MFIPFTIQIFVDTYIPILFSKWPFNGGHSLYWKPFLLVELILFNEKIFFTESCFICECFTFEQPSRGILRKSIKQ